MPDAAPPRSSRREPGPARHELPGIDEAALTAARTVDAMLVAVRERGVDRWVRFLEPLPERLRDGELRDVRAAAQRVRAAFGPKDSIREALPDDMTEPAIVAADRLLKALARHELRGDR
jgi:hypothetical protein